MWLMQSRLRVSAGLVVYRIRDGRLEVFLVHPGGPFFARRDEGAWSIPKGEIEPGEKMLATALREFKEEVGIEIDPTSQFLELGSIRQKGGKIVHAWGVEKDYEKPMPVCSNTFEMEWPPHSGRRQRFPEVDRAEFLSLAIAKEKIKETQVPLLERLAAALGIKQ
jgi:predicted NUDIX family NTP pyrophosphohydrolase